MWPAFGQYGMEHVNNFKKSLVQNSLKGGFHMTRANTREQRLNNNARNKINQKGGCQT
jgi:hypothetical protein